MFSHDHNTCTPYEHVSVVHLYTSLYTCTWTPIINTKYADAKEVQHWSWSEVRREFLNIITLYWHNKLIWLCSCVLQFLFFKSIQSLIQLQTKILIIVYSNFLEWIYTTQIIKLGNWMAIESTVKSAIILIDCN